MLSIQEINAAIINGDFTNNDLNSMIDAIKFKRKLLTDSVKFTIRVGSAVKFTSNKNGRTYQGTVEAVKIKYATVNTQYGRYRVPMNMLDVVA